MNILYLSKDYPPSLIGGVGVYMREVSHLLRRLGHSVFVITVAEHTPSDAFEDGVRVIRVLPKKIRWLSPLKKEIPGVIARLEYSLAVSQKIRELVRTVPIDIVESSEARAEGLWYFLFNRKPPLVIKLHTPETIAFKLDHTPETLDYRLIKLLEEYWIGRATQITGLSDAVVNLTARILI